MHYVHSHSVPPTFSSLWLEVSHNLCIQITLFDPELNKRCLYQLHFFCCASCSFTAPSSRKLIMHAIQQNLYGFITVRTSHSRDCIQRFKTPVMLPKQVFHKSPKQLPDPKWLAAGPADAWAPLCPQRAKKHQACPPAVLATATLDHSRILPRDSRHTLLWQTANKNKQAKTTKQPNEKPETSHFDFSLETKHLMWGWT